MTTEDPRPVDASQPEDSTKIDLAYAGPSQVEATEKETHISLIGNLRRPAVRMDAKIKRPLRFREAMSSLYAIVASDFRYVPKDRTAYAAYMRMKRETSALDVWKAQQAYFSWLLRNDPTAFFILDPVITVHPDRILFEVFSKDEGTYAKLAFNTDAFESDKKPNYGTTNIDYSQAFFDSIQAMRGYRETKLTVGREAVQMATTDTEGVLEKSIQLPDSWLRGFLQVQSASTLPRDTFSLAAMDIYNVLRYLRMHKDIKGKRRGLRVELIPGEKPRLVLEPWETLLTASTDKFTGKASRIIRIWGRRRLMLLRRILPFLETVDVHVLGSGLPSFWVFRCGDFTLTLGITGFTAANWSQALNFDLLLPRKTQTTEPLEKIIKHLSDVWFADRQALSDATGLKGAKLVEALQNGCQQGRLIYDLSTDVYRLRPLTEEPLDLGKLEFRNNREKIAHDLIVRKSAVKLLSENRIAGTGLELTGEVEVAEDKRGYRPKMLLGDEGEVFKAECTCSLFRKQGLKDGPCAHLIALRLIYAEEERKRQESDEGRMAIQMETRTYTRRDDKGEDVMQLSLEKQKLRIRWGRTGQDLRLQTMRFNTPEEARAAYFSRIDRLSKNGYLDATAG